jgi:hypothetical protein
MSEPCPKYREHGYHCTQPAGHTGPCTSATTPSALAATEDQ